MDTFHLLSGWLKDSAYSNIPPIYGEDRGHGWLLNHPLRKLLFYQHYLDTQARLAPAAKATTPTKKAKKAKKTTAA